MTLVPSSFALLAPLGFDLSQIQLDSLTSAAQRMEKADSPLPATVRQDTAGTVHLTWLVLGCRIVVELTKSGDIRTAITMKSYRQGWASIAAFQVQLQEFFAL